MQSYNSVNLLLEISILLSVRKKTNINKDEKHAFALQPFKLHTFRLISPSCGNTHGTRFEVFIEIGKTCRIHIPTEIDWF